MERFYLEQGLVILREGHHLEYHHRSDTTIYFENPLSGDIESIAENQFWREFETQELTVVDAKSTSTELELPEPDTKAQLPIALGHKYEMDHLRKLDYVKGMRRRNVTRGQIKQIEIAITEIAKEANDSHPPKAMTVSEWMRKIERARGDHYVVVSKHAKRGKRERQDLEHEALIDGVIKDSLGKLPVTDIYNDKYKPALKYLNTERARAELSVIPAISRRSFNRRVEALDRYDVEVARHGRQEARRKFRMIKGHMPGDRPLDYVEIDHAQLRLWVVDELLMLPLGRPWVTAVRDRYTGMLLGFYISFRGPSLASIFGAIRHSLSCHLDLNKIWPDLEHPWVAFGPGTTYVSDRGADYLSPRYRYAIHQLKSDYSYCESRTPWHKPHIERVFRSIHDDLLEALPGEVFKGMSYHRDYNPKEDAVVRISTLVYLLVKWAVDYHPYRVSRSRRARPIDLWMDGIGDAPIGHLPHLDALNIILGRTITPTLGHEGLRFSHLQYSSDELEQLYRAIDRTKVEGVVCEENLGRICVVDPRDRSWFNVPCTRPEYAEGLSLYQHQYLLRQAKIAHESVSDVDQLLRFRTHVQVRIAEDLARKDSATKARLARFAGIDSGAVFAGKAKSLLDLIPAQINSSARTGDGTHGASNKVVIPDAAFTDVPVFRWGVL